MIMLYNLQACRSLSGQDAERMREQANKQASLGAKAGVSHCVCSNDQINRIAL